MSQKSGKSQFENLPSCVVEFVELVVKKMRYRRKVRQDVCAELSAHFEDELKICATEEDKWQKAQQLIADFGDPKLLATLIRRAKKRCRPVWKKALVRSFQVLGILCLYLVICSGRLFIGKPTISVNYVDWLNKLAKASRDEDLNAKPYFDKAAQITSKWSAWQKILENTSYRWPGDMNDLEREAMARLLAENTEAFAVLREGVKKPYFWVSYNADHELLTQVVTDGVKKYDISRNYWRGTASYSMNMFLFDEVGFLSGYRNLARNMAIQIVWEAYCGNTEEALDDAIVLLKFGLHLQSKGLLMEQLSALAVVGLARERVFIVLDRTNVPPEVLKKAQDEIEQLYCEQGPAVSCEAEKALWYDYVQKTFTDDGKGNGRVLKEGVPLVIGSWEDGLAKLTLFGFPDRKQFMETIDRFYEQINRIVETPPWEAASESKKDLLENVARDSAFLRSSAPSFAQVSRIAWRSKTGGEALITILAVMRYQKEYGYYPANLEELVMEKYLSKLPVDPYSGGPLVYTPIDDGFLLYSVGSNLRDDGGGLGTNEQGQPRMWADNGDWVYWPILRWQR